MRAKQMLVALLVACLLVCDGCGGFRSSYNVVPLPSQSGASAKLELRFVVAQRTTHAPQNRKPQFISADTAGVSLTLTGSANVSATFSIGPGTAACGGSSSSPRTCGGSIAAPPGNYTIVATSYDAAPVAGTIPSSAHELATGTVTGVSVLLGHANSTALYLGGEIANLTSTPAYISLSPSGLVQQIGLVLAPTDYNNEAIVAGANDPYKNPITISLAEAGGSGHESLVQNGTNMGSTAVITRSTDSVSLVYDGAATGPGYGGTLLIGASGVATTIVYASPLVAVPSGVHVIGGSVAFTDTGQSAPLAMSERNAPNTIGYTVTPNSCAGAITANAVSGNGSAASATLTSTTAAYTSCSVTVTDSLGATTTLPSIVDYPPYVAAAGTVSTNATFGSSIFTLPALPQTDDRLVLIVAQNTPLTAGQPLPSGWSYVDNVFVLGVVYCVVGTQSANCPAQTSYTFGGNGAYGQILDIRGGNPGLAPVVSPDISQQYYQSATVSTSLTVTAPYSLAFAAAAGLSFTQPYTVTGISLSSPSAFSPVTMINSANITMNSGNVALLLERYTQDVSSATQPFAISASFMTNGGGTQEDAVVLNIPW